MNKPAGLLIKELLDKGIRKNVSLTGVAIEVNIEEVVSVTEIIQHYKNSEKNPIEAVYCFPVEESAAVCGFEIQIDDRIITGTIEEREKAFEVYDNAISQGNGAFLLDQESQDVLYISVGNIKPDQDVTVTIRYVSELPVSEGIMRLQIPSTVSPRYSPKGSDPMKVDRINPPFQKEVPYRLSLQIKVATVGIREITSPSHTITVKKDGEYSFVGLSDETTVLDRDFILEVELAKQLEPLAIMETHQNGDTALLFRFYPEFTDLPKTTAQKSEVIFVLDCSGSMRGSSINEAKSALELSLRSLNEGDLFNIVLFGSSHRMMSPESLVYSETTFSHALDFIKTISANMGGTKLAPPMAVLCNLPEPQEHTRDIILLTDGEISNPDQVISMVSQASHKMRVFTFGIGYGASHHLVKGIAGASNGACEMIQPGEKVYPKVLRQFSRLMQPVMTNIAVVSEELELQLPAKLPPLFEDDSYTLYARVLSGTTASDQPVITLSGDYLGKRYSWNAIVRQTGEQTNAIPILWALSRIKNLKSAHVGGSNQRMRKEQTIKHEITSLGLSYGLLTDYTSFVAVEKRSATEKTAGQPEFRRIPVMLTKDWHGRAQGGTPMGAGRPMRSMKKSPMSSGTGKKIARRLSASPQAAYQMFAPVPAESDRSIDRSTEWYIALMESQHPQGFFDGMEIVCSQKGIRSNRLKILASKIGAGSAEEKIRISVTLLAIDLLKNDRDAQSISRRSVAKAQKWLEETLRKLSLRMEEVKEVILSGK